MTTEVLQVCERASRAAFGATPPRQLPSDVAIYLAHVEAGMPMRAIASAKGSHPSTILRAVRRVETLRDDPLLDRAVTALEGALAGDLESRAANLKPEENEPPMQRQNSEMSRADKSVLRKLSEPEAFLMVAGGADKAGVFCRKNQFRRPLELIDLDQATGLLKQDWIKAASKTDRSVKYRITSAGRASLRRALEADAPAAETGFSEAPSVFSGQHQLYGARRVANVKTGEIETVKVNLGESPLGWLARRKGADGAPLLSPEEVEAGERLREDFELAQIGPKVGQDWRRFLTAGDRPSGGRSPSEGPLFARERVAGAVEALGPGLSDAALRVCCFLEGLEATERRMGWSARSGKVVLKLALARLVDHYGLTRSEDAA